MEIKQRIKKIWVKTKQWLERNIRVLKFSYEKKKALQISELTFHFKKKQEN